MLRVGLTGNIAAGKSTVAAVWRSLGATIVDADVLAREAVAPGTPALSQIAEAWGPAVLTGDGHLDRGALREIVFADPDERERLEAIVHPAVAAMRDRAFRDARTRGDALVVADIPLLFEAGLVDEVDLVVLVDAPEAVRLLRLIEHRGLGPDEANAMISAQMPAELKRARADVVIENAGPLEQVQQRATEVWRALVARAGQGV